MGRHDDGCVGAWRGDGDGVGGTSAVSQYQREQARVEAPGRGEMQMRCGLAEMTVQSLFRWDLSSQTEH